LEICKNIIDLEGFPAVYDGQDQDKPDDDPVCHWSIGLIVVSAKDLMRAIKAKSCFPFVDLLGEDVAFAPHLPDPWEDGCPLWNFALLVESEISSINLSI